MGFEPTTSASAALGATGLMKAALGFLPAFLAVFFAALRVPGVFFFATVPPGSRANAIRRSGPFNGASELRASVGECYHWRGGSSSERLQDSGRPWAGRRPARRRAGGVNWPLPAQQTRQQGCPYVEQIDLRVHAIVIEAGFHSPAGLLFRAPVGDDLIRRSG